MAAKSFLLTLVIVASVCGQSNGADPSLDYRRSALEASALIERKEYERAIPRLERLVERNPADGSLWRMLGDARYERKLYRDAISAWKRAIELGFLDRAEGKYRIAAAHALLGEKRAALESLEMALANRYRRRTRIAADKRFESLRDDPDFRRIAGLAPAPAERVAGWSADLDHLVAEIRRVHYRYSHEPLPAEFLHEVEVIRGSIPGTSDSGIVVGLQRLVSLLGDGHSLVFPFGMRQGALHRIPLSLYFFSDGLFVVDAPEDWKSLVGMRIESLGPIDPKNALDRLQRYASRDNPMSLRWTAPVYLTFVEFLEAIGATEDPRAVRIVLTPSGSQGRREVVVHASEEPADPDRIATRLAAPRNLPTKPPLYLRRTAEPFWFEKLPDGKTVYFQFNRVLDAEKETLAAFAIRLRRFLGENRTENLIVDVRLNNGGEGRLLKELVRTMVHFETGGEQQHLIVLIGRNTFSAAQQFVGALDALASPLFIGEPTGSKPKRPGDEALFALPFSGVTGSIASGFHQTDSKDDRVWIAPAIPVELSAADYFSNRDPVLEAALAWIRSGRP